MRSVTAAIFVVIVALTGVKGGTYNYLGCYSDDSSEGHDLSDRSNDNFGSAVSVDKCARYCKTKGYPYAGVQMEGECYCGNTFGKFGDSSYCNTTCNEFPPACGGYKANSVYYTVDKDLSSQRHIETAYLARRNYVESRMACVKGGGDLLTPDSPTNRLTIASQVPGNDTSVSLVWVGLRRRLAGKAYEWTDENLTPKYVDLQNLNVKNENPPWSKDEPKLDCVAFDINTKQLQTAECTTKLPFACTVLPGAVLPTDVNPDEGTPATGSSDLSAESKRLAMFIVLPLFLCCYGGSCVIYCVHKIIRNCLRAEKVNASMTSLRVDDFRPPPAGPQPPAPPVGGNILGAREKQPMHMNVLDYPQKRPFSGGKHSAVVAPSNRLVNATQPAPDRSVTSLKVESAEEMRPMPPPSADARRARILENAAREARERRGASRPGTAVKASPPKTDADTSKLIDDDSPRADGSSTPQGLAGMSIKDILKLKMAQKADGKRKPRKIITS